MSCWGSLDESHAASVGTNWGWILAMTPCSRIFASCSSRRIYRCTVSIASSIIIIIFVIIFIIISSPSQIPIIYSDLTRKLSYLFIMPIFSWKGQRSRSSEVKTSKILSHIWYTYAQRLSLTIVRPNLLSTPETLVNWTDGRISCRHSAPTSLLFLRQQEADQTYFLWLAQWKIWGTD